MKETTDTKAVEETKPSAMDEVQKPGPMGTERKFLQSKDVKWGPEPVKPTAPNRGPQTGMDSINDVEFLKLYATTAELQIFRASVEARKKIQAGAEGWRELPNGSKVRADRVLAGCFKCGAWLWVEARWATSFCPNCNATNRPNGGQLRAATSDEEKAWFERETASWKKFLAAKPKREAEINARIKRQLQDGIR